MISAAVDTQGERFSQPVGGPTSLVDLPNAVRPVPRVNPNRKKVLFVNSITVAAASRQRGRCR